MENVQNIFAFGDIYVKINDTSEQEDTVYSSIFICTSHVSHWFSWLESSTADLIVLQLSLRHTATLQRQN